MSTLTCPVCHFEVIVDRLETAELAGGARSTAGWICESYDCYQSCPHQRRGLHPSATGAASEAEGLGVC